MTKLSVDNLHLTYGAVEVLKGVSLELRHKEIVVLLGPSGSGKTSLLRAIAGLEEPRAGSILIDGKTVFNAAEGLVEPPEKRGLGVVFQSYALWPHRTLLENVTFGLRLRGVTKAERELAAGKILLNLGLAGLEKRFPHQLSGGQQQRVALARALAYEPPVVLMDEPLSNLDAQLRAEAKAWLKSLIVRLEISALLVTHDQSEAMALADRIVLLNAGRIVQEGPPEEIYQSPNCLFSAAFFGSNTRLVGTVVSRDDTFATFRFGGADLTAKAKRDVAVGQAATLIARAESLSVHNEVVPNSLRASLVTSLSLGSLWEHVFKTEEAQLRASSSSRLNAGEHWLGFDPNRSWIFPMPNTNEPT